MSKFKHHNKIDVFQSKQKVFFRTLWDTLQQRGWRINQDVAELGNEFLGCGDGPDRPFVTWELVRSTKCQPVYLDFTNYSDCQFGHRIYLNDFSSCRLRGHEGKIWYISYYEDDDISDILKTLDEIEMVK